MVSVAAAVLVACSFFFEGRHLRYLSFTARPTWPQATAELEALVASAEGVKTSDVRVAKSESTIFIAEVGFQRPGAPITTTAMDERPAQRLVPREWHLSQRAGAVETQCDRRAKRSS